MRALVLLVVASLISLPAFAKAPVPTKTQLKSVDTTKSKAKSRVASKFTGKLLSYAQLMRLSKKKRMAYLRDTVDLLATMESFSKRYTVAERDQLRELREQIASWIPMMSLLPKASADEYDDEPGEPDVSGVIPAFNGVEWTCGRGLKFDYVLRACTVLHSGEQNAFPKVMAMGTRAWKCPSGTHAINHYRAGAEACIPNANWELLPVERRKDLEEGKFKPARYLRKMSQKDQLIEVWGKDYVAAATGKQDQAEAPSSEPPEITKEAAPAQDPSPAPRPTTTPKPNRCEPAAQSCKSLSDSDRQVAMGRFYKSTAKYQGQDPNICITGGFATKYKEGRKAAGNCEIIRSLPLGDGKTTKPCGADEAMCNPALFCLGGKFEGKFEPVTFCVKLQGKGENLPITDACATKYGKMLKGEESLVDCEDSSKLKGEKKKQAEAQCAEHKKVKPEKCDPGYLPDDAKFKKIWEDLIAQTQKLRDVWCGNKDFAALFCRECEIVNDKIYSMNEHATGSGCPEVQTPPAEVPPVTPKPEERQGKSRAIREA